MCIRDSGSDTYSQDIIVNALPNLSAVATSTNICEGDSVDLNASGANSYTWDNGVGTGANVIVAPTTSSVYEVTGIDLNGCENIAQVAINVNPNPIISLLSAQDPSSCLANDGILTVGSQGTGNLSWVGPSSGNTNACLLYTSPSPRDATLSRMPSSA